MCVTRERWCVTESPVVTEMTASQVRVSWTRAYGSEAKEASVKLSSRSRKMESKSSKGEYLPPNVQCRSCAFRSLLESLGLCNKSEWETISRVQKTHTRVLWRSHNTFDRTLEPRHCLNTTLENQRECKSRPLVVGRPRLPATRAPATTRASCVCVKHRAHSRSSSHTPSSSQGARRRREKWGRGSRGEREREPQPPLVSQPATSLVRRGRVTAGLRRRRRGVCRLVRRERLGPRDSKRGGGSSSPQHETPRPAPKPRRERDDERERTQRGLRLCQERL